MGSLGNLGAVKEGSRRQEKVPPGEGKQLQPLKIFPYVHLSSCRAGHDVSPPQGHPGDAARLPPTAFSCSPPVQWNSTL